MAGELRADQRLWIPRPLVLWIAARTVRADEGAAVFHPRFEGRTLRFGQQIAAGVVPDHQLEAPELLGIHHGGVLGDERRPSALLRNRDERGVRRLDRGFLAIPV